MSRALLVTPVDDSDHIQGPPGADLTLVEYGDYECPRCRLAHEVVRVVRHRLGSRVRYVFRNFPVVSDHPQAELAAAAAEAAATAGRFWEMHDLLFAHQGRLAPSDLLDYAVEAGLDAEELLAQLAFGDHTARVRDELVHGMENGVRDTPTFFVNGVRYDGPWAPRNLVAALLPGPETVVTSW